MPIDITSAFHRKVRNDEAFIVSETANVASGGTYNLHLKNPEGSGKELWSVTINVSSDGAYIARVYDGFTSAPSGGTETEIQSMLLDTEGVNNDGVAEANTDVSFTNGSTHAVGVGGGGPNGNIGGPSSHATMAIQPGREVVIQVENTASNAHNYGISVVYYQKDT